MASDSFVNFTEADIKSFTEKQEIVNTKKKPSYDLKLFMELLASDCERRALQETATVREKVYFLIK